MGYFVKCFRIDKKDNYRHYFRDRACFAVSVWCEDLLRPTAYGTKKGARFCGGKGVEDIDSGICESFAG